MEVVVAGKNWDAANAAANQLLADDPSAFFVHPFDQESTWQGHSTLVDEVKEQLVEMGEGERSPAAVVTCVGGGGLAIGETNVLWVNYK